jgi:hypothetical protein
MTQEDKELLLKDLCSRLPYGVMCRMSGGGFETIEDKLTAIGLFQFVEEGLECVPYLRPMPSMTGEEKHEISVILNYEFYVDQDCALVPEDDRHRIRLDLMKEYIDWLNKHMLDYRGLIEKGLALEALEGMYNKNTYKAN